MIVQLVLLILASGAAGHIRELCEQLAVREVVEQATADLSDDWGSKFVILRSEIAPISPIGSKPNSYQLSVHLTWARTARPRERLGYDMPIQVSVSPDGLTCKTQLQMENEKGGLGR